MNWETWTIILLFCLVFLSGTFVGQLMLKIKLTRLENDNLKLENKKIQDLKDLLQSRSHRRHHHKSSSSSYDRSVKDEIDDLLSDIEKP